MEGFYREINGAWQYAKEAVFAPNYTLLKEERETLSLPIDGWDWYDTSPVPVESASLGDIREMLKELSKEEIDELLNED